MQHTCTHTHTHTHTHTNKHIHTHTHTQTHRVIHQGNGTEQKVSEKRTVFKEDLKELTEAAWWTETRKLILDSWSLVRERALTTGQLHPLGKPS